MDVHQIAILITHLIVRITKFQVYKTKKPTALQRTLHKQPTTQINVKRQLIYIQKRVTKIRLAQSRTYAGRV